jgi:hypothetical protein
MNRRVAMTKPGRPIHFVVGALALAVLLVAPLACDRSEAAAKHCRGTPTKEECEGCCKAAGRSGATWLLDDCECHER